MLLVNSDPEPTLSLIIDALANQEYSTLDDMGHEVINPLLVEYAEEDAPPTFHVIALSSFMLKLGRGQYGEDIANEAFETKIVREDIATKFSSDVLKKISLYGLSYVNAPDFSGNAYKVGLFSDLMPEINREYLKSNMDNNEDVLP